MHQSHHSTGTLLRMIFPEAVCGTPQRFAGS